MGIFKNRAIALEEIKIGTIGVLLEDETRPARLWEIQTIWRADGELTLISPPGQYMEPDNCVHAYPEEFWPLIDSPSPYA